MPAQKPTIQQINSLVELYEQFIDSLESHSRHRIESGVNEDYSGDHFIIMNRLND